ncbi:MAG: beta-galactosidase, partial [Clostridia bacterium]|nr:beta-galactosidase [Clostridia bacterium]
MQRTTEFLKTDFKFQKFSIEEALPAGVFSPDFDDSGWRTLRVPHDWGIEGDFDVNNDPCRGKIVEDGQKVDGLHTGRTGGLPTVGKGVYRKWVTVEPADRVFLELDGVMWQSEVYCNGVKVGGYHFGYGSYEVELTDSVKFNEPNLIAVYAEVGPHAGRWYTGGGLYRNLRLVRKDNEHIKYNGIWVRQRYADRFRAMMDIAVETDGDVPFTVEITDPNGKVTDYGSYKGTLLAEIGDPILWDVENPALYTAKVTLPSGDSETVRFGIRICEFTKDGFFLNGRYLKMNGVCMHHDQGMLGAAVTPAALRRQIEIMKGMGVNAWRTSHNPPAPELLDLCDEMGILVMDEFFDEWAHAKVKNGYAKHFKEHAIKDATAVIRRDRNHPSVIMWSIGNEIPEQVSEGGGRDYARMLYDVTHAADPTRPVTGGLNRFPEASDGSEVQM